MNRNIDELIQTGSKVLRKNSKYDLKHTEGNYLYDKRDGDIFGLMVDSFRIGIAQGMKIAKKEAQND